ncbi:unnamed protein product [Lampetra fluviatilis]
MQGRRARERDRASCKGLPRSHSRAAQLKTPSWNAVAAAPSSSCRLRWPRRPGQGHCRPPPETKEAGAQSQRRGSLKAELGGPPGIVPTTAANYRQTKRESKWRRNLAATLRHPGDARDALPPDRAATRLNALHAGHGPGCGLPSRVGSAPALERRLRRKLGDNAASVPSTARWSPADVTSSNYQKSTQVHDPARSLQRARDPRQPRSPRDRGRHGGPETNITRGAPRPQPGSPGSPGVRRPRDPEPSGPSPLTPGRLLLPARPPRLRGGGSGGGGSSKR